MRIILEISLVLLSHLESYGLLTYVTYVGLQTDGYVHQMLSLSVYKLTDTTSVSLQTVLFIYIRTLTYLYTTQN